MSILIEQKVKRFSEAIKATSCTLSGGNEIDLETALNDICSIVIEKRRQHHLYVVGNGGSAAIAAHVAIDFRNVAKFSAFTLHEPSTLTCLANDYGYENSFSLAVQTSGREGDVLIAISSSGNSPNIINAVKAAKDRNMMVITFTGFGNDNAIRGLGDLNFWVNSNDYGVVENTHQFLLHCVSDEFL